MLRKKTVGVLAAMVLVVAVMTVAPSPSSAGIVGIDCLGDDSVLPGVPDPSQDILDFLGGLADPPVPPPNSIAVQISVTTDPASFAPGTGTYDFYFETLLSESLLETAIGVGITELTISNAAFTLAPGLNVTGADLDVAVPEFVIDLTGGVPDTTQGPFPGTFDVTGASGDEVTFDLTAAQFGFTLMLGVATLAAGLTCSVTSGTAVAALVIDANGPQTPSYAEETPQDTPVSTDVAAGVTDGPAAPTDFSTLRISADPTNGTVALANGVATYTPAAGFTGDDQYRYEVCTEEFVTVDGVNQVTQLVIVIEAPGGDFQLEFDGDAALTTAPIVWDATAAEVQSAIEAVLGAGAAVVTDVTGGGATTYDVEFMGDYAQTEVVVTSITSNLEGSVSASTTVNSVVEELGVICNQGLVDVTVVPAAAATPPPPPPPPATPVPAPQPAAPSFTG